MHIDHHVPLAMGIGQYYFNPYVNPVNDNFNPGVEETFIYFP